MWNKRPPPLPTTPSPITLSKVQRSDSVTSLFIEEILTPPGRVKKSPIKISVPVPGRGFRTKTWKPEPDPEKIESVEIGPGPAPPAPRIGSRIENRVRHGLNQRRNYRPPEQQPWWMIWACYGIIVFLIVCFLVLVAAMAMTASSKNKSHQDDSGDKARSDLFIQADGNLYEHSVNLHEVHDRHTHSAHIAETPMQNQSHDQGQDQDAIRINKTMKIDCKDHNCTLCRDFLEQTDPEKICDAKGKIDCEDRSDEIGCPCRPDSVRCHLGSIEGECINPALACDGVKDCQNGEDERECIALSKNITVVNSTTTNFLIKPDAVEGYVIFIRKGVWHSYCTNDWNLELGRKLCEYFGYGHLNELRTFDPLKIPDIQLKPKAQGVVISNNIINSNPDEEKSINPQVLKPDKDKAPVPPTCHVAYLVCTLKPC